MRLLYISTLCNKDFFMKVLQESRNIKPTPAGERFDHLIGTGLSKACDVEALSFIPVASYPNHKKLLWLKKPEVEEKLKIKYIPFINITLIKQLSLIISIFVLSLFWVLESRKEEKVILVSTLFFPFIFPVLLVSKMFGIKKFVIVADVPQYMANYRVDTSFIKRVLSKVSNFLQDRLDSCMDGYILLSPFMNEIVNKKLKPFVIVEGMIEDDFGKLTRNLKFAKDNAIMYAGGLNEKYGIGKLIDAFLRAELVNIELWVFGAGDYEKKIIEISEKHNQIKFFGMVSHSHILEYEKRCRLLINPRPTDEAFTKYSFPSKTIEYMASGTPLLTTKIQSIPIDYFDYLYFFNDETVEGMAADIKNVVSLSDCELNEKAIKAKKFIMENKTDKVQNKKIIDFIMSIVK